MSAVAIADGLSTVGFALALLFIALIPISPDRPYMRPIKLFMIAAMAVYVFVGISNTLEWSGVTRALDGYEDYAEVLFIPLVAYLVYSVAVAQQLEALQHGEDILRGHHELLENIVETSPAGVLMVTPAGAITFANGLAQDILGLKAGAPGSRLVAPPDVRFSHEAGGVTSVAEGLSELVERNPEGRVIRFVEHPGGRMVVIDARTEPLQRSSRDNEATVVAFVDVTSQIRYRQDLEEAVDARTRELIDVNRKLEEANEAKGEFLARMSHELRTPLNSIIGFTSTLLQGMAGDLTEEQQRQLEAVSSSSHQLLSLVDDVLDISLIESGRRILTPVTVDVHGFLNDVFESMEGIAREAEMDMELDCPTDLGEIVTDKDKLAQVLRNLLSNSIKFTKAGGWIRVVGRGDEGVVSIAVSDSGVGISPADLENLFEPFNRQVGFGGRKPPGTRLGLAICSDLLDLLRGDIAVESELGKGSTFTVTMPRDARNLPPIVKGARVESAEDVAAAHSEDAAF